MFATVGYRLLSSLSSSTSVSRRIGFQVFYLGTGLAGIAFLISFSLGWTDIRKKEATQEIKKTDTTTASDTV